MGNGLGGVARGAAGGFAAGGPVGAGIGAGLSLLGGWMGGGAAKKAAAQQYQASQQGRQALQQYYTQIQQMLDPYRRTGENALPALSALAGGSTGYQGRSALRGVPSAQQNPNPPSWAQPPPLQAGTGPGQLQAPPSRTLEQGMQLGLGLQARPEEQAYIQQWLADNPTAPFTDRDLHGYRNTQTAQAGGLTEAQWNALSPADQKVFLGQMKMHGGSR